MALKYTYLLAFITPLAVLFSINSSGILTYSALIFAFIVVPILDIMIKENESSVNEIKVEKSLFYDIVISLMLPLQYVSFILFLEKISIPNLSISEKIGIISAFGISCGVLGINVAHELGHRLDKRSQIMAKLLLISTQYLHFYIEHNRGHHKNVGTELDSASAMRDESLYKFVVRSIIGSYFSAWNIENKSLELKKVSIFSFQNQMLRFQIYQLILILLIYFSYGLVTVLFYIISAFIGIILLESVNYVQHYGLRRKQTEHGYERVNHSHSWNSDNPLGRIVLFELSRHSDHHAIATKPYQTLKNIENSPQMPTGYPGMILLAFIPPLWFRTMNKILDEMN